MKTVVVTGANGFLGSHLAAELAARGWRVRGTTRSAAGLKASTPGLERQYILELGGAVDPAIFAGADAVVHCAYDLRPERMAQNVRGTEAVVRAAAAAGAARQLFIGSYSAHAAAASAYGRTKFALQKYFLALGHTVARPGLVIGPGGMFARLARALKLPVVPLADGGRDRVPVVAVSDCASALAGMLERDGAGVFHLFNDETVTLRALVEAIRAASGGRAILLPVPSALLATLARAAGALGFALPFDAENLSALKANQNRPDRSDLKQFVAAPLSLTAMVERASLELARRGKS